MLYLKYVVRKNRALWERAQRQQDCNVDELFEYLLLADWVIN